MKLKLPHQMTAAQLMTEVRNNRAKLARIAELELVLADLKSKQPKRCELNVAGACDCDKVCEYPKQYGKGTKKYLCNKVT